jgi:type IV pilus assembly protein PilF
VKRLRWMELGARWWLCCAMGLLTLALLSACASGASKNPDKEMVTNSDDPPARKRARVRLELAAGYFQQAQHSVALDEIKLALAADPDYADAYSLRGLVYWTLKQNNLADESFKRALRLESDSADIQHNYAWFLCQNDRFDEALAMFDRLIQRSIYRERSKTLTTLGLCQLRAKKPKQAEHSFMLAYELEPNNPIIAYNWALLLYQRQAYKQAQFLLQRINVTELANAETLWLALKVENRLEWPEPTAKTRLSEQLKKGFAASREARLLAQGVFDD